METVKRFVAGPYNAENPLRGQSWYLADTETKCSDRKCGKACEWPECSKDLRVFSTRETLDRKAAEMRRLGHIVREDD